MILSVIPLKPYAIRPFESPGGLDISTSIYILSSLNFSLFRVLAVESFHLFITCKAARSVEAGFKDEAFGTLSDNEREFNSLSLLSFLPVEYAWALRSTTNSIRQLQQIGCAQYDLSLIR